MPEQAVPVAVHGMTWTAALVGILNLLVGGALVALVKQWPNLRKLNNEREAAQQAIKRDEMDDMRERIAALETKVDAANKLAHDAEMKLVYAVNAVQLLAARIRADNPDDPTLKQAMEMLAAATSGGLPGWAGRAAEGLNRIRGVGE